MSVFGVILVHIFSEFSRIPTEFEENSDWILRICLYSVRMRKSADQNNSEYGYFLRSVTFATIAKNNWKINSISIQDHLNEKKLIYMYQSGSRTNHSTDFCLLQSIYLILSGMDKQMHACIILVDLQYFRPWSSPWKNKKIWFPDICN